MHFQTLNIEEDPLSQSFPPKHFDFVIALQVFNATRNSRETLQHLNVLLRPGGMLLFTEQLASLRFAVISFGLLDSWWRGEDARKFGPLNDVDGWQKCREDVGFENLGVAKILDEHSGAIWARKRHCVSPLHHVERNQSQNAWLVVDDGPELVHYLTNKLEFYGRNVQKLGMGRIPLQLAEFQQVFNSTSQKGSKLEGILFLCTKSIKEDEMEAQQMQICVTLLHLCQAMVSYSAELRRQPRFCAILETVKLGAHSVPQFGGS